jgi:hypothetical protein
MKQNQYERDRQLYEQQAAAAAAAPTRDLFERLSVAFDESGILCAWTLEDQDGLVCREEVEPKQLGDARSE